MVKEGILSLSTVVILIAGIFTEENDYSYIFTKHELPWKMVNKGSDKFALDDLIK